MRCFIKNTVNKFIKLLLILWFFLLCLIKKTPLFNLEIKGWLYFRCALWEKTILFYLHSSLVVGEWHLYIWKKYNKNWILTYKCSEMHALGILNILMGGFYSTANIVNDSYLRFFAEKWACKPFVIWNLTFYNSVSFWI